MKSLGLLLSQLPRWGLAATAYFILVCCAPNLNTGQSIVTGCQLPSDELGTLKGRWLLQPVPIAFQEGSFAAGEMAEGTAAADTWNSFYGASLDFSLLDYGGDPNNARQSSLPKPTSVCTEAITKSTGYSSPVVIYKDYTWPYTSLPNAIALTTFCPAGAQQGQYNLQGFDMAIVEVNYQSFFTAGNRVPDLQSILLHELGHVAGLAHSCEETGFTGMPACDPSKADEYNAVMAPVFTFDAGGNGEQKRSLGSNDMGRANCLYIDLHPGSS